MLCAIHQPNFFPWLGFFDKIVKSDVFVFMDDVQLPYKGNSYSNRVSMKVNGSACYLSCPIQRDGKLQIIKDVMIQDKKWREKIVKTIEFSYKKANHYSELSAFVFELIYYPCNRLADYNIHAIKKICTLLEIGESAGKKFVVQSDLGTVHHSTRLLIEITKRVGCDSYLCGGGTKGYQEDTLFEQAGIDLLYQNYKHPEYIQGRGKFVPGLSILDALFYCGVGGTQKILMQTMHAKTQL